MLAALVVCTRNSICFVSLARSCILRVKDECVLCSAALRMPRNAGIGRTGKKHKRKKEEPAAASADVRQEPRIAAMQAAVAAADAALAQSVRMNEPVENAVREWVAEAIDDVVRWEEQDARWKRVKHDRYAATAIACHDAYLRKYFAASAAEKQSVASGAYRAAYAMAQENWQWAYPDDICHECEEHLSKCDCRNQCGKCGESRFARAWRFGDGPKPFVCRCEKLNNLSIACLL